MATVTGPIMSINASGAVGDALIYSRNKGRNVVKSFASPAQPNTNEQFWARQRISVSNLLWKALNKPLQDDWSTADNENIGKNPTALSSMMIELHENQMPTAMRNPTPPIGFPSILVDDAFQIGRNVAISATSFGGPLPSTFFILLAGRTGPMAPQPLFTETIGLIFGNGTVNLSGSVKTNWDAIHDLAMIFGRTNGEESIWALLDVSAG